MKSASFFILFVLTSCLSFAQNTRLESYGLKGPVSSFYTYSYDKLEYDTLKFPKMRGEEHFFFNYKGQLTEKNHFITNKDRSKNEKDNNGYIFVEKYFYNSQGICEKIIRTWNGKLFNTVTFESDPPLRYYKEHWGRHTSVKYHWKHLSKHMFSYFSERIFGRNFHGYMRVDSLDRIVEEAKYKLKDKNSKEKYIDFGKNIYDSESNICLTVSDTAKYKRPYTNYHNTITKTDKSGNWTESIERWDNGTTHMNFRLIDYDFEKPWDRPSLYGNFIRSCPTLSPKIDENYLYFYQQAFLKYKKDHFFQNDKDYKKTKSEIRPKNLNMAKKCYFKELTVCVLDREAIRRDSVTQFSSSSELVKYLKVDKIYYSDVYYKDVWQMGVTIDDTKVATKYKLDMDNCHEVKLSDKTISDPNKCRFIVRLKYDRVCFQKGDVIMSADYKPTDSKTVIYRPLVEIVNEYLKPNSNSNGL